jgi:hypothetical protein
LKICSSPTTDKGHKYLASESRFAARATETANAINAGRRILLAQGAGNIGAYLKSNNRLLVFYTSMWSYLFRTDLERLHGEWGLRRRRKHVHPVR